MNPAFVVAGALANADLDVRLVEALPLGLVHIPRSGLGLGSSAQCRLGNQQNRLGYLVSLAMKLAKPGAGRRPRKRTVRTGKVRALAVEGTLCRESMSAAERTWARKHRPTDAAHWNLLTTLTADQLTHAA